MIEKILAEAHPVPPSEWLAYSYAYPQDAMRYPKEQWSDMASGGHAHIMAMILGAALVYNTIVPAITSDEQKKLAEVRDFLMKRWRETQGTSKFSKLYSQLINTSGQYVEPEPIF